MLRARVDRQRCIGAGTCITLAPTAFDWLKGEFLKADVVDTGSVDEEQLREAAFSCPTAAIIIEEVEELLPWQLRGSASKTPRRIMATFMFTDCAGTTRRCARFSTRTVGKRSTTRETDSSSASKAPMLRSRAPSRFSGS